MSTDRTVGEQNVFRCTIAVIECFVISFTETLSERLASANIDLYNWKELDAHLRLHPILIWHLNM